MKKTFEKYSIRLILLICISGFLAFVIAGCAGRVAEDNKTGIVDKLDLRYATQFSVDYYPDGYIHIHVEDGNEYIIVPDGKEKKSFNISNVTFISKPVDDIYLAASSAMDLFLQLGCLDNIKACSTSAEDYSMQEVKDRIDNDIISYVGKYSAPDYEKVLNLGCDLSIESTMIYHSPEIKEQLEKLGIPVLVERSSYEEDPLGRLEWIRLYGIILGKEKEADQFFEEQCKAVEDLQKKLENDKKTGKSVAFFYISANGYVNVRKPGDYLSKMIEMAGGSYALENLQLDEDNALSTININWEDFYREAKDADILIYNGTIDGGVNSLDELISKNELFKNFKAVKDGNVWSTDLNMFQETSKITEVVEDFYKVINEAGEDAVYLKRCSHE
ncbi:MAG: ABC transporter substrate-binding protein [Eubacterium sp.]|nr:ABC transporter substrate-binding protein [Eubacterium sp.]